MLDSLYTEAAKKKNELNDSIDDIFDEVIDIESFWHDETIVPSEQKCILAAGDGSFNKKKFMGFNFYAVAAESLIYNPNDEDSRLSTIESVELDIMPRNSFADDRLRNMMGIFEIKTAIKSFNDYDVDYYMDDGSILGDLIRPIPLEKKIPSHFSTGIINRIQEKLEREINSNELRISSLKLKEEFEELFDDENIDEYSLVTYLENLEKLIALKNLLSNNEKIIAISKTSTSNDLFHTNVPDMAIFDRFTRNEGFSKPYYKKVTNEVKRDFPIANDYFRGLWFTIFFARLENNKNMIKIELPFYASEDEIRKILGIIKSNATDGYPFLLKRAHHDVVIKHRDIESLSAIMEFMDKSGREMLD